MDSTPELQDLNEAYQATAYAYNWPSLLVRQGIAKVANLDRYTLPTNFRKARTIKLNNAVLEEVELEFLKRSRGAYVIDQQQNDVILYTVPSSASTAYTLSNAEVAGNAVTIELDTVTGLSTYDEIWIDSAAGTDEFTMVSSIDTTALTITARLKSAKSAADILYRQDDIIDLNYYRRVTLLSATGDTMLLPQAVDYIVVLYAAYLAYLRLEMYNEATMMLNSWKEQLAEAWRQSGKSSTGAVTSFSIA